MTRRLLISFSGGETSGYMAALLQKRSSDYDEVRTVFANTGQEHENTLAFVDVCDRYFGLGVVWVEAVARHGERKAPDARVVDFATAARNGEPFEDMIKKHGIPNTKFKHCTRELKYKPIRVYLESIGWKEGTYDTAIGIRADEIDRVSVDAGRRRIVYPLIRAGVTKPKVNSWWSTQDFRLGIKGYEGNCVWCWKKSRRKHLTLMRRSPGVFDFPERMEATYGTVGAEFRRPPGSRRDPLPSDYRRTFFRGNASVADLRAACAALPTGFTDAPDDSRTFAPFDPDLDLGGGCEESCEIGADEDSIEDSPT